MNKKIEIDVQKQINLFADGLARILIQQVLSKKNLAISSQIEIKYGKPNK